MGGGGNAMADLASPRMIVKVGQAEYDLTTFVHPGGQLAMFGIANSPDPLGLLFQYHEFTPARLASILKPYCVSAEPAALEYFERSRQPYTRVVELRLRIKEALRLPLKRLRIWESRFTFAMSVLGWPAFLCFAFSCARGGPMVQTIATLLYALFVHVVLVWNLHGQSHLVSRADDGHLGYCISCIPFAPHSLAWFMQHTVQHHSFTGVALDDKTSSTHVSFDPDVRFSGVLRLSPEEAWLPHHRFQPLYAPLALGLTVWALLIDMVLLTTKHQLQLYEQLQVTLPSRTSRALMGLVACSALAVAGAVCIIGMPIGCFLRAMTLCSFTVGYINIPTHTNLKTGHAGAGADYLAEQLAESTSYGGVVDNFLTAGLSKQIEHHIFPNAPFSALPLLTPFVAEYAAEHGLPYHYFSNFGSCLVSWYRQVCFLALDPSGQPEVKAMGTADAAIPSGDVPAVTSFDQYRKAGAFDALIHAKRA